MSKDEVKKLSDEELISNWEQIKAAFRSSLPQHLTEHQSLVLFADFVNISTEMTARNLDKKIPL